MPQYYPNQSASLPWSSGQTVAASVVLDQQAVNVSYTNLDQISGKVVVRCAKSVEIDSIVVKVEGESRTRLMAPPMGDVRREKPVFEYHRLLYKTQIVFPSPALMDGRSPMVGKAAYTLGTGNHEYPFKIKLPFNNACASERSQLGAMSISGSGVEVTKPALGHVKKTLPPTLSGFPGEAEIRYFVKATVRRKAFFKENPRAYVPFNFFPIEPPRPTPSGNEAYARQRHNFSPFPDGGAGGKSKMKSLFSKSKEKDSLASPVSSDAPSISVDARLPEPAILTCNDEIPLRVLVRKLNDGPGMIYLDSLQVSLIGATKIRAHDIYRTETNSWIIMSKSNIGMALGNATDPEGTEYTLPNHGWRGNPLPNTVAPSFKACNIERTYQVDVRIGLSYSGQGSGSKVGKGQRLLPQTIILPLRLDCTVYSGIAPPPQLLAAMAEARDSLGRSSVSKPTAVSAAASAAIDEKLKAERPGQNSHLSTSHDVPETPIDNPTYNFPARQGTAMASEYAIPDDAPPSYEDAVASSVPSVQQTARPQYAPPAPTAEDEVLRGDEKKRRDS